MADLKALGPDGFHAIFFKKCWKVVGDKIYGMVADAFITGTFPENFNETHIVLIPKTENPQTIQEFWPISLCNMVYKILSKVIVNRLKPFLPNLISPNQVSFVPKRQLQDNIFVFQEVSKGRGSCHQA